MAPKRPRPSEQSSKQPHGKRRKGGEDAPAEADPAAQVASVKAYMFHATKLLLKALKKSRTFETQKLTRKVKQTKEPKEGEAAAEASVVADLEAQLALLKSLPLDPLPPYLLNTRLSKLPFLRSREPPLDLTPALPAFTAPSKAELDPTSIEGKARNRVLAHKAVKEAWEEVSRAVAKRCGEEVEARPEPVKAQVQQKKVAVPSIEVEPVVGAEAGPSDPPLPEKRLSKRAERAAKGAAKALLPKPSIKMDPTRMAALAAASDSEEESEDEGPVSGSEFGDDGDEDDEVARELARLGGDGASGSEGGWSGSEAEEGVQSDADDSDAESDSSFPLDKPSTAAAKSKPEKQRKVKPSASTARPITSSSFLPTLAGGYISYSDSDGEDAQWVKDAEKGEKKERKNRRGQRARQAIWEKKYGSGANHVVKTTGGVAATQKGKHAKKTKKELEVAVKPFDPLNAPGGSTNVNAQPLGQRKVVRPTVTYKSKAPVVPVEVAKIAQFQPAPAPRAAPRPAQARAPLPPPKPPVSRIEEGMHPSWEAKRRAQEALANLASAPKGKKITFD